MTNVISIDLVFDQTAVDLFKAEKPNYRVSLFLNKGYEQQYGPGVFLDTAQDFFFFPTWQAGSSFPSEFQPALESRFLDINTIVRYGVILRHMDEVQSNAVYTIFWRTPPGQATRDDGTLELRFGRTVCYLDFDLTYAPVYSIDPIPGTVTFSRAEYSHCFNSWLFLPAILHW